MILIRTLFFFILRVIISTCLIFNCIISQYACRKTLADRRVRVRGRFARNNEQCDDQKIVAEKIIIDDDDLTRKDMQFCCDDAFQVLNNIINYISMLYIRLKLILIL